MGPSFESFVNQIAMKENHSGSQAQVKAMAVKQRECQAEDDWTIMRGALAVLCAAALFASGAESQLVDLVALALMLAGVTWLRKIQKKWDREDEPLLGGPAPKAGETAMRARNEPMVEDTKEKKRSDQTRRKVARAQNEPARGTHPPDSSPTGSRQGQSGDQKTTMRPRAMVRMLQADDGGPPRAQPHEPWWHPPFHVPPTGTTDRWQVVENFVVRVHCKMRYQNCHPFHSSYPLRDEQILTGRRVTIKYIGGEQPGRPSEDSWIEPPTRESRMNNKIEGRWNGSTFFELHSPVHGAKAASYYVGTRPVGEWARQEHTLPPHLRIPEDMRAEEAADLRRRRVHDPVGTGMTTERTERSSASADRRGPVGESPPINSTASASTALLPGATAMTAGRIGKPPPPMPPMERWTGLPEGLRLALQALTDSDWERPPGSEPIYWVQVGNRMFHRNDLMRQAIMMEQQPDAEVPQLQLTLVEGRTENGTPCYIATAMPEVEWKWHDLVNTPRDHDRLVDPGLHKGTSRWKLGKCGIVQGCIDEVEVSSSRRRWHHVRNRPRACSRRRLVPMGC